MFARSFIDLPMKWHIFIGAVIRLSLIMYADYHDQFYDVQYTDIDYKVFTDAARHVVNGTSPYRRHTYRYSPIIAFLMIPNVILHPNFGKVLFSLFDILITLALEVLVETQLKEVCLQKVPSKVAKYSALIWLYNPLSIAISTRGNADSLSCFLIIVSLYFLQTDRWKFKLNYALSGMMLGISIHLRLYPLAFSFPMYVSLGTYCYSRSMSLKQFIQLFIPNIKQIVLTLSCVITLIRLTLSMYSLYGDSFIVETYLYHMSRKDIRHNFSVLFYYNYLSFDQEYNKLLYLTHFFLFFTLILLSWRYGNDRKTLPLALFCQAFLLVAYNSVVTCQYFVWFLSLLPLVAHSLKLTASKALLMAIVWALPQASWLFYAYLLEFMGREVFLLIWIKCIIFFCVNVFILGQIIKCYSPGHAFGYAAVVKRD